MSWLTDVEAQIGKDEVWVINFFATLKQDVQVVEQDLLAVLKWLGAHGSEIAGDVAGILGIIAAAGVGIPAPVLIAAQALNSAVSAVNAAIAAQQVKASQGGGTGEQVVAAASAGYQALKNAQIATAQAQQAVAKPPTP